MIRMLCKYGEIKHSHCAWEGHMPAHGKCRTEPGGTGTGVPERGTKAQAGCKGTHGQERTKVQNWQHKGTGRDCGEKPALLSALHSLSCTFLESPPCTPTCKDTQAICLLRCCLQAPLGSLFLQLLIIHSCMQAFIQQTLVENGFWQESRFHLALEQSCQEIAMRKWTLGQFQQEP